MKSPYRDIQQEAPVCACAECGGEIYTGEWKFNAGDGSLCLGCFKAKAKALLETSPAIVARYLGYDVETA